MFTVSLYKNCAFKNYIWQELKWERTVYLAKLTQLENSGIRIPIQVWLTPKHIVISWFLYSKQNPFNRGIVQGIAAKLLLEVWQNWKSAGVTSQSITLRVDLQTKVRKCQMLMQSREDHENGNESLRRMAAVLTQAWILRQTPGCSCLRPGLAVSNQC